MTEIQKDRCKATPKRKERNKKRQMTQRKKARRKLDKDTTFGCTPLKYTLEIDDRDGTFELADAGNTGRDRTFAYICQTSNALKP